MMESPPYSARLPPFEGQNGVDRPLPPIPNAELDLYSAEEDSGHQKSFSQHGASVGRDQLPNQQSGGESSQSASRSTNEDISSSRLSVPGSKGSGSVMRASGELLARTISQNEVESQTSRIRSVSSPLHTNGRQGSSSHYTNRPSHPRGVSRNTMGDMPYSGRSRGQTLGGRQASDSGAERVTVSHTGERGQSTTQYQFNGDRVILPRWQPDSEVLTCPICNSFFSMFNRKHHCRKCGKVVCASCSPHRITIPREYIVSPQPDLQALPSRSHRISNASLNERVPGHGGVEGGERVRLCNPCVPDPNTAPPQFSQPPPYSTGLNSGNERRVEPEDRLPISDLRAPIVQNATSRTRPQGIDFSNMSAEQIRDYTNGFALRAYQTRPHMNMARTAPQASGFPLPPRQRYGGDERGQSVQSGLTPVAATPPRRQPVPEEDLCPVCGGLYSDQIKADPKQKEKHIERCIEELSKKNRSNSQSQDAGPSSTQMRRGMTKYTGTARDAIDGEECQICLEDFLPTQELARLTCFCRYHAECITGWWNKGQFGKCPTHDHGL